MILSCSTCSLTDPFGRIENLERWRSVAHSSPLLLPLLSSGLEQDLGSFDSDHTLRFLALGLAAICPVWMIPDLRRIPDSRQVLGSTRCPTHQTEHYPSVTHVCMWRSHFMSQQLAQRQEGRRGHKKANVFFANAWGQLSGGSRGATPRSTPPHPLKVWFGIPQTIRVSPAEYWIKI